MKKKIKPDYNKILGKDKNHKLTIFEHEYCKEKISAEIPKGVDVSWLKNGEAVFTCTTSKQDKEFCKICKTDK